MNLIIAHSFTRVAIFHVINTGTRVLTKETIITKDELVVLFDALIGKAVHFVIGFVLRCKFIQFHSILPRFRHTMRSRDKHLKLRGAGGPFSTPSTTRGKENAKSAITIDVLCATVNHEGGRKGDALPRSFFHKPM